eukprot:4818780-Amphidinium_carterae.1
MRKLRLMCEFEALFESYFTTIPHTHLQYWAHDTTMIPRSNAGLCAHVSRLSSSCLVLVLVDVVVVIGDGQDFALINAIHTNFL